MKINKKAVSWLALLAASLVAACLNFPIEQKLTGAKVWPTSHDPYPENKGGSQFFYYIDRIDENNKIKNKELFLKPLLLAENIPPGAGGEPKNSSRAEGRSGLSRKVNPTRRGNDNLRLLHVSPQGKTLSAKEVENIVVIFDQPMVALQALPEAESISPLKIEPKVPGKVRWLGTRTVVFTPAMAFPFSTQIKVTIPAGTTALDGSQLTSDFSWTFETPRPALIRHFPANNQRWLSLALEVLLVFNQPMDRVKAGAFITWVSERSSGETALHPEESPEKKSLVFKIDYPKQEKLKEAGLEFPAENVFLLTLAADEKLEPDSRCFITLKKGLPGKEGPLGLDKDYSFMFETYREFRFEGLLGAEEDPSREAERIGPSYLPRRFSPKRAIPFRFSNPVTYKEFVSKVKFEPGVEIPDYYGEWEESAAVIYLDLPLQPETRYKVMIPSDLRDEFGNKLGQAQIATFLTGSYEPAVSMTTGYGVIESYISPYPRYLLSVINQKRVFVQAGRLSPETIIPVLIQRELFRSDRPFPAPAGFFQLEKELPLKLAANQRRLVPIDLSPVLTPFRHGLVFLQVDTNLPDSKWNRYLKALLQITELAITAKFSAENIIVWVTELKTGLPVAGVKIEIREYANNIKWQGETDASGRAETPGWKKLGLSLPERSYEAPKLWVFARRGEDVAFISSGWEFNVDPYRFDIPFNWLPEPQRFQGYIFTERGIYRASEEVHIKGIVRENIKGQWKIPTSLSLLAEITDPLGKGVFRGQVSLDEFGSFDFDFKTNEQSALGTYEITVLPSDQSAKKIREKTPFRGSFRVEAFRPAEFEVLLRSRQESYVFGENYQAEIRGNYLFGGLMAGQDVSWYLRLNRASFSPPGHQGFIFGNELEWQAEEAGEEFSEARSRLLSSGEAELDAEGKLSLKIPLLAEKERDSVMATLEATVTGPSRQSIANRVQTLVHRGEYYIGLRPSISFLKKGETISTEVITCLPDGRLSPGHKVSLKLFKREWHSVRQASVGGRSRWRSETRDIEVGASEVTSADKPVMAKFRPEKAGFYFFLASAEDSRKNLITTTSYFYVTGADYVAWERREDDMVELVADAPSYRPGETSRLLVKSPYEKAKALLTIEREHIIEAKVIDIEGTASYLELPIKSEYIPNVFVSLILAQGRQALPLAETTDDLGIPSFKVGYLNLPVDPEEKRLRVRIDGLQPEYRPRQKVQIRLKVEGNDGLQAGASLAVACVDLGVLNLIGFKTPDPFSFFYGECSLSVGTSDTRIHLISQRQLGEKGEEPGGGGEASLMDMAPEMAEIMLRGTFRFTAYWNPKVVTDDRGEATVSFILPDNLTTFRVMAVTQTKDSKFGQGEATFRVSKKLMLQPSTPRFCRVGDTFEAGVVAHNFSDSREELVLNVKSTGLTPKDKRTEHRVSVPPGESREFLLPFQAEKPGEAILAFEGRMGKESDGLEVKIPVYLPRPTESVALYGEISSQELEKKVAATEKIILPETRFPENGWLEIQAASSALVGLEGSLQNLVNYPYACLEQRVSSLLPFLVGKRLLVDFMLTSLTAEKIDEFVRQRLREIASYQKAHGGFSAWPDSDGVSPFLTCYAVFALIKAREAGYDINPEILDLAARYLTDFVRSEKKQGDQPLSQRGWSSTRAYALYILSLLKKPQTALMAKLFDQRESLSLFGRTLLLKAMYQAKAFPEARNTLIKELLNKIKVRAGEAYLEDDEGRDGFWLFSSNGRTTASGLQTLVEVGYDHPSLAAMARWLVNRQKALLQGNFGSTQENFYLFYGLSAFYSSREAGLADFTASFSLLTQRLFTEKFSPATKEIKKTRFRLDELLRNKETGLRPGIELPLRIEQQGRGSLYYGVRITYAPPEAFPPRDNGLAVIKSIEPLNKNLARGRNEIKAGSLAVVTLEIAFPQESMYVVVNDPLPAGFEAINPAFQTESEEAQRQLAAQFETELQKKRVWWSGFDHVERHDDRVLLFANWLPPGVYVHRYLVRALNPGIYGVPGTKVEQMYSPEVFGRTPEITVKIGR